MPQLAKELNTQELSVRITNDSVHISGYVNAVGRDSREIYDWDDQQYVEQIKPGTFARAMARGTNIDLMLDHYRTIGDTNTNLTLHEDAIGLYAEATITDYEVIKKAREKKLRGWSFGFYPLSYTTETRADGMERRIVDDMELIEVTIVDDEAIPCYEGTSIEARKLSRPQVIEVRAKYSDDSKQSARPSDAYYEDLRSRINKLSFKED